VQTVADSRWVYAPPTLALAAAIALIWGFWSLPLYDLDEGAFTEATREMIESGNYISIYLNGEPRHDKPILIYWLQAASVHLFGLNEFALRLPSVLAGLAWLLAVVRFAGRQLDADTGYAAGLVMALSLYVGIIVKGAVADALLHLFLALSLFEIYAYSVAARRSRLYRAFLWMGLGFLTKGPVAVFLPFVVSAVFFLSYGRWREWLAAVFDPRGLLLFAAIVLPWHVAVYLDSGWAFFQGFYLHHNVDRYSGAMEGHSGNLLYYLLWAPLLALPFTGLFVRLLALVGGVKRDPLDRFLWIWFFVVLLVFSFSATKLPHYLLYGFSPVFILLARYRKTLQNRLLAFVPPILLLAFLLPLPFWLELGARQSERAYEQTLFRDGAAAFGVSYWLYAAIVLGLAIGIALWRRISPWRGLVAIGFLQSALLSLVVIPQVFEVMQGPVKEAALLAKENGKTVVRYRAFQPSFSLYREAIVRQRRPEVGEWVLVRVDHLERFVAQYPRLATKLVYSRGPTRLLEVRGIRDADG
jgi:4-amino-4-deoxy-L-arabinose transferase-like glycosyltransferase